MYSSAGTATAPDNPGLDPTLWQENSAFSGLPQERTETNIFRLSYDEGDTGELSLNQFNFRDGTASTSTVFEGGWVTAGTNVFLRVRLDAAEQTALQSALGLTTALSTNVQTLGDVTVTMTHSSDPGVTATYRVTEASLANGDTSLRVDPTPISESGTPTNGNTFQFDFTRYDRVGGGTLPTWEATRINNGPWNIVPC